MNNLITTKKKLVNFISNDSDYNKLSDYIKSKRINILIIRFLCCFFVTCLHLIKIINKSGIYYVIYPTAIIAVDVFIMCTSFSSFNKTKSNYKHWFKMVLVLYIWNILIESTTKHSINDVNWLMICLPFIYGKGWYLIVYIFFYPLIPILNNAINNRKKSLTFCIFYVVFCIMQYFNIPLFDVYTFSIFNFIFLYMFTRSLIFLLTQISDENKVLLSWIAIYIMLITINILSSYYYKKVDTIYSHLNNIGLATAFFMMIINMKFKQTYISNIISLLGSYSLYYYMFDNILIYSCSNIKINILISPELTYFIAVIIKFLFLTIIILTLHFGKILISKIYKRFSNKKCMY